MSRAAPLAAQQPGDELWHSSWVSGAGEATILKRQAVDRPELKLFSSWFCPFAQRAWIAAEEKGLDYQWVEINPYEVDPSAPGGYTKKGLPLEVKRALHPGFVEASPRGLIPAMSHDGRAVWDSAALVEYIDEAFDGPPLMPSNACDRARVRIYIEHVTHRCQRAYYTMLMAQNAAQQEESRKAFFAECREFSRAMRSDDGPYFLGEQFSAVDIAFAPFYQRFLWVGKRYRDLAFPDEAEFHRLSRWWEATRSRPSVACTFVCKERLISSYRQYALNIATSDYAKGMQSSLKPKDGAEEEQHGDGEEEYHPNPAYEQDETTSAYLLYAYGEDAQVLSHDLGPINGYVKNFPKTCAEILIKHAGEGAHDSALDLGCGVGRSSFELATHFTRVHGVEYSRAFVEACERLKAHGRALYTFPVVGAVRCEGVAAVDEAVDRSRVRFSHGDATNLPEDIGTHDAVLLANLVDRVRYPRRMLNQLPRLVRPGGVVLITSPYTWLEEFAPKSEWLGGTEDSSSSFEVLCAIMKDSFDLVEHTNVPMLIREHSRKHQLCIPHCTVWRRKKKSE